MNFGQFRVAVATELGLSSKSDGTGAEQVTADAAINRAMQRVLEDTHCYVKQTDFATFDGTNADWDMSGSGILEILEAQFISGGTTYPLERLSITDLLERRRVASFGAPSRYYSVQGENLLMLYPTPGSSDTLVAYHVPLPTAMTAATDDPSTATVAGVPEILHEAIFLYACAKLASGDDDQTSAQGQRYIDLYDKEITRYRTIIRKRGGTRNARIVVNEKRRNRVQHDNSVYPRY